MSFVLKPKFCESWVTDFKEWDECLALAKQEDPESYQTVLQERCNHYSVQSSDVCPQYVDLFRAYSCFEVARAELLNLQADYHKGYLKKEKWMELAQWNFKMMHDAHAVGEVYVEGQRGDQFMIQRLGYPQDFFLEKTLALSSCEAKARRDLAMGRNFPFILMEDPWEYCNCFCAPLLGQNGALYSGVLQFLHISDVRKWLQSYWTLALQTPDDIGTIVEEIKTRFRLLLLLGKWVWPLWRWLEGLFSQEISSQTIQLSGIPVYQHRIENQEQLEAASKLGYGAEMDLALTKDGRWIVYHEQAWHGVDIIELDYKFLEREKIPLFSALRSANNAIILDIKSHDYHRNLSLGDEAVRGLLTGVSHFGGDSHLITIASTNRDFLQRIQEKSHEQGLHCQTCLTVIEFDVLEGLVQEWKSNPRPEFPFACLSPYGSHYRRLVQQLIARGDETTLVLFRQRFKIIIAENALDSLAGMNFSGLYTGTLSGNGPGQ